jgi:hypothetical protein
MCTKPAGAERGRFLRLHPQHALPKLSFAHGMAFVAIGAVLVGLIAWAGGRTPEQLVARGLVSVAVDLNTLILMKYAQHRSWEDYRYYTRTCRVH